MKWSTPLPTRSIGIRAVVLQFWPSDDLLNTMSFAEHLVSNRQSCQATYTVPLPEISAEGSALVRRPPELACDLTLSTTATWPHEAPPSSELNASILPLSASNG